MISQIHTVIVGPSVTIIKPGRIRDGEIVEFQHQIFLRAWASSSFSPSASSDFNSFGFSNKSPVQSGARSQASISTLIVCQSRHIDLHWYVVTSIHTQTSVPSAPRQKTILGLQ